MSNDKIVILICGYTKAEKSKVSRLISEFFDCEVIEMSQPIRNILSTNENITLELLLNQISAFRQQYGEAALAYAAVNKIFSCKSDICIVAGVRKYADFDAIKKRFDKVVTVYVQSYTSLRHLRLASDLTSIAKTTEDFNQLDRIANNEGLRLIASKVDYHLINEEGYPLTLIEQIRTLCEKLTHKFQINLKSNTKEIMMENEGVIVKKLPVYDGNFKGEKDLISRIIKPKGELATLSISEMNYLAYVEFPDDGEPRANHYHSEKQEYLYLIKGKVKLFYRRGGQTNDEVSEIVIDEGSLVYLQPGFAHAYITIEPGFAIEFSPTKYNRIKQDKVRDYVVPK